MISLVTPQISFSVFPETQIASTFLIQARDVPSSAWKWYADSISGERYFLLAFQCSWSDSEALLIY